MAAFSDAGKGAAKDIAVAKVRSNRVKSELITKQGLTEDCFITRNHSGGGDCVTVRIVVPVKDTGKDKEPNIAAEDTEQQLRAADKTCRQRMEHEYVAKERTEAEQARTDSLARAQAAAEIETETVIPSEETSVADICTLSLRANLLRWATLTPDLGLEWRITPSVGIAVNGSWTSWPWNDADRRYALWEVAPEVRWYLGETKRGYIGAMYKAGQFNYKLSATGRQGDLMGGITGSGRSDILTARAGNNGAGIGGYNTVDEHHTSCGDITVSSVTVDAYAAEYSTGYPGIGGHESCGTITIDNATVYARGTGGSYDGFPAIGAGSSLPDITISGSDIHAFRGSSYADWIGLYGAISGYGGGAIQGTITNTVVHKGLWDMSSGQATEEGTVEFQAD